MTGDWVFGAIAVLALLHGMTLLYAYRRGTARGAATPDAESYVRDDGVECPSCGADNGTGYRFCRRCVSELPGSVSFLGDSSAPASRRTL
jgi:ribosomal protein L40E